MYAPSSRTRAAALSDVRVCYLTHSARHRCLTAHSRAAAAFTMVQFSTKAAWSLSVAVSNQAGSWQVFTRHSSMHAPGLLRGISGTDCGVELHPDIRAKVHHRALVRFIAGFLHGQGPTGIQFSHPP